MNDLANEAMAIRELTTDVLDATDIGTFAVEAAIRNSAALDGNMFRKFAVTSSTKPLSVNPADVFDETPFRDSKPTVVRIGDDFVGLIMPVRQPEGTVWATPEWLAAA